MISINLTILIQVASFLFLVFVLKHIFYKPVLKVIDEREKNIADDIMESAAAAKQAKEKQDFYDKELHKIKIEAMNRQIDIRIQASLKAKEMEKEKLAEMKINLDAERRKISKILEEEQSALPQISDELTRTLVRKIIG